MGRIEARLAALGLALPPPPVLPEGVALPFPPVHVVGRRVFVSGHGPQAADGRLAGPFGQVGGGVSSEEAAGLARLAALSILGSLQRALGDLDRIAGWGRLFGMVNAVPGFRDHPAVINGASRLIHEVFGQERGRHARSAVGMASLPFGIAVEIEAELLLQG